MSFFRSFGIYGIVLIVFSVVIIVLVSILSSGSLSVAPGGRLGGGSYDGAYCGGGVEIKCPVGYICVPADRLPGADGFCVEKVD